MIRVRFPPSPTGYIHLGTARTALFNWLFARKHGGTFILRIEDTDPTRSKKEYEDALVRDLKWLGIDWDEGPDIGGPFAPYRQTERLNIYRDFADKLLTEDKAYYCFCFPGELEKDREEAQESGKISRYSRKCRYLSSNEREFLLKKGIPPAIRLKAPLEGEVVVEDIIRGKISFSIHGLDDFVIMRSDGSPTYNFAVSIDDYLMKVTHIIRGEDHLHGNTPRQMLIYQSFDWEIPIFGHLPMVLGSDRSKLSKRHGALAIHEYRNQGYLSQALVNYLALLGWSPGDERELFTIDELISAFNLNRVGKSPAIFDEEKLKWLNHHHIAKLTDEELLSLTLPFFEEAGYRIDYELNKLMALISCIRSGIHSLREAPIRAKFLFVKPESYIIKEEWEKEILLTLINEISNSKESISLDEASIIINNLSEKVQFPKKKYLPVIRMALTGEEKGIELARILYLLGKEEILFRIHAIISRG